MVYHLMCGYLPEWVGEVVGEIYELSGKPVWPIIQSVSEPTSLSAEEYGPTIDVVLHSDVSDGILVFTMKRVLLDQAKLAVTKAKVGRTGELF